MPNRRDLLVGSCLGASALFIGGGAALLSGGNATASTGEADFPMDLSADEWADRLTAEEFAVLRLEETEPPFSSPLDDFWEVGMYHCAACGNRAYSSEHKYDSGTGWPSFWRPVSDRAIGTKTEIAIILPVLEVHCARCGGHFGHIFKDGPEPTGQRHCLNGLALDFVAA